MLCFLSAAGERALIACAQVISKVDPRVKHEEAWRLAQVRIGQQDANDEEINLRFLHPGLFEIGSF
jgi:hypothetical protein